MYDQQGYTKVSPEAPESDAWFPHVFQRSPLEMTPPGNVYASNRQCFACTACTSLCDFIVLVICLGACVLSFFYCVPCLFVVIAICFAFCCCAPYLNIPLWFSLLLLLLTGFSWFPDKRLNISWAGGLT